MDLGLCCMVEVDAAACAIAFGSCFVVVIAVVAVGGGGGGASMKP
jgi:hypothetical protein